MFLTARILFLNEEDYIEYVIRSIYPAVESIVIVEGCIEEYGKTSGQYTPDGLSTDRSSELINDFITAEDPDGKIKYSQYGFAKCYGELANFAVTLIPHQTTHFLNVDSDEVYCPKDILGIKGLFSKFPGLCGVAVDRMHFYLDFWILRHNVQAKKLEVTGGTMFRKFYPGELYPEKRAEHNPSFAGKSMTHFWHPWWEDDLEKGIAVAKKENLEGITWRRKVMPQFHYGWVRQLEKMTERLVQTYRRVDAYSGSNKYTSMTDEALIEFLQLYNPVFTGVGDSEDTLQNYVDRHPDVMRAHPFYGMRKEDFGWP